MAPTTRSIPSRLASLVEDLELEQPKVVTVKQLDALAGRHRLSLTGNQVGYELRRLGWLLNLRTKGAWEFAPAARAGAFGGGDRHVELRAVLGIDRNFPGVLAMESAAVALGLGARVPQKEVLTLPPGRRLPKSLDDWRVVRLAFGGHASEIINGLPTWRVESLLCGMAARPDGFQDWPNVGGWLGSAVSRSDMSVVRQLLDGHAMAVWRRTAYLMAFGGNGAAGDTLMEAAPEGKGPIHFGPRNRPSVFDAHFGVVDSVLAPWQEAARP
jgi:hypothetical protein